MTAVEERLRQFMRTQFLFEFDDAVTAHSDLFDLGLIDSFGFVELVSFIESEFHVKFTDEELISSSLNSLANMVAAIGMKIHA